MSHGRPAADTLREKAQSFADDLTTTVRAVVGPQCPAFRALALHHEDRDAFTVRQEPDTGIPLLVNGAPLLTLTVSYECVWDDAGEFLAVNESKFKVYNGFRAAGEPLYRYEFNRAVQGDLPGAHLHLHGQHDALTYVMTRCGTGTRRGRKLAASVERGDGVPRMRDLHFPVGGSRFRPCLEDVLDMLVRELGVDRQDGWREALADGREKWRRAQVGTAVRDAPDEAVRVLEQLGYEVRLRDGATASAGKRAHLRDL